MKKKPMRKMRGGGMVAKKRPVKMMRGGMVAKKRPVKMMRGGMANKKEHMYLSNGGSVKDNMNPGLRALQKERPDVVAKILKNK